MKPFAERIAPVVRLFDMLTVAGAAVILLSLSYDVIANKGEIVSPSYLLIQLIVCLVFLADFFLRMAAAQGSRGAYFLRNIVFLLVSIPWLNIVYWLGLDPSRDTYIILKSAPLLRGLYAIGLLVGWYTRRKIQHLFVAYLFIVLAFTYFAALIFYCYEYGVNPRVDNFGNSLWWAWMGVTTVGAAVFPVTAIGKVLAVMLPSLGMMMFPIFTIYVTNLISNHKKA